uniref:Uncharacterized protein n=1 Tax=Zooxanthella nutricula TaxID=1333877 RepID=A0A7S2VNH5_9DINO
MSLPRRTALAVTAVALLAVAPAACMAGSFRAVRDDGCGPGRTCCSYKIPQDITKVCLRDGHGLPTPCPDAHAMEEHLYPDPETGEPRMSRSPASYYSATSLGKHSSCHEAGIARLAINPTYYFEGEAFPIAMMDFDAGFYRLMESDSED